jgi:hypothetical protein
MADQNPNPIDRDEPVAPSGLVKDLRSLHAVHFRVPTEMDERIVSMARRALTWRRPRTLALRWAAWAALAASVAVAVLAVYLCGPHPGLLPTRGVAAREDLNGDGRVDILDAFALARWIEVPGHEMSEWDVNGDGAVDRGDVDAVAMKAVSLDGGVTE